MNSILVLVIMPPFDGSLLAAALFVVRIFSHLLNIPVQMYTGSVDISSGFSQYLEDVFSLVIVWVLQLLLVMVCSPHDARAIRQLHVSATANLDSCLDMLDALTWDVPTQVGLQWLFCYSRESFAVAFGLFLSTPPPSSGEDGMICQCRVCALPCLASLK